MRTKLIKEKKTISLVLDLDKYNLLCSFADKKNINLSVLIRLLVRLGLDTSQSFNFSFSPFSKSKEQFLYERFIYALNNGLVEVESGNYFFPLRDLS